MKPRKVKPQQGNGQRPDAIVFFDGICNLCNSSVDFLIRNDRSHSLKFSPLQGEMAQELVYPSFRKEELPDSILFVRNNIIYAESDAALQISRFLPWYWSWVQVFLIIPRPIRDFVYRIIAKHRYRWFGKKQTCRLPTAEEAARFLD